MIKSTFIEDGEVRLHIIEKAVRANFDTIRRDDPKYYKPLRATDNDKNPFEPSVRVKFSHKGEVKEASFQKELPIVMAVGIADHYDIDPLSTMQRFSIDMQPEYDYKLDAFNACMDASRRAVIFKMQENLNTLDDAFSGWLDSYRFYLKYELVMNYIRLYGPRESTFFDDSVVIY